MKAKRFLSIFIAVLMLVSCFAISASANETYTLNIHLYETQQGTDIALDGNSHTTAQTEPTGKTAIPDVTFKIYKVADDSTSTTPSGDPVDTKTTDASGLATFTTTTKGRYLVVVDQSTKPEYGSGVTVDGSTTYVIPFLVDLPRTSADGTTNENTVDVYPKMLVTGAIDFTKTFNGNAPAAGVTATFTITGPNGYSTTETTDEEGHIKLSGLEFGEYTFTETAVTSPFEVNSTPVKITVNQGGYIGEKGDIYGVIATGTMNNGSNTVPMISKKVSSDGTNFAESANIDSYNDAEATWRIAVAVPKDIADYQEFVVTDVIDSRLTYTADSAAVTYSDGTAMTDGTAKVNFADATKTLTVTFDQSKLIADKIVYITFTTKILDASDNITTGEAIPNHAVLSYKNAAYTEGTVPTVSNTDGKDPENPDNDNPNTDPYVYTGKIDIVKLGAENAKLAGAEFTLTTADGTTLKAADSTLTTNADGEITLVGLLDGTYTLTETKAPAGYQLIDTPITITVADGKVTTVGGSTLASLVDTVVNVTNIPKTDLPLTGGMGTALFSLLGAAFVAFGGVMFVKSRKAKASL